MFKGRPKVRTGGATVRSFSSVDPSTKSGTILERKFGVFCKWVTANAHNVATLNRTGEVDFPFKNWRTARPWLTYEDVHRTYLYFLKISVGFMQCENHKLTNDDVHRLVMFERRTTQQAKRLDAIGVRDIILQLFSITPTRRMPRTVVFKDVNMELERMGMPVMTNCSIAWLGALRLLCESSRSNNYHNLCLRRKFPHQKEVEDVLLSYYAVSETNVGEAEVFDEISAYFRLRCRPLQQKDLAWTACWEKYKGRLQRIPFDLDQHVLRWYAPSSEPGELRSVVAAVVNHSLPFPLREDSPCWDHSFGSIHGAPDLKERVHLCPRSSVDYVTYLEHEFERSHTTVSIAKLLKQIHTACNVSRVKETPFVLQALSQVAGYLPGDSHVYLRKKQEVPWNWLVQTYCVPKSKESGESGEFRVVALLNFWLLTNGFESYDTIDPIWEWVYRFRVRYDVCGTLKSMREECPEQYREPPFQIPTTKGMVSSTRIFPAFVVDNSPEPLHMTRARLEVNRRLGCSLKARSTEWLYSTGKRARSELARPAKEKVLLAGTQVYRHNPHDYTVATGLVGATVDRHPSKKRKRPKV